jgi:hypothetical protein
MANGVPFGGAPIRQLEIGGRPPNATPYVASVVIAPNYFEALNLRSSEGDRSRGIHERAAIVNHLHHRGNRLGVDHPPREGAAAEDRRGLPHGAVMNVITVR